MSKELDELIAMNCPDLKTNGDTGNQVLVLETPRRSSNVKQMTLTELASARAAAATAAEIQVALEKAKKAEIEMKKSTPARTPTKSPLKDEEQTINLPQPADENNKDYDNDDDEFSKKIKSKLLPTLSAPRDRITSLPNILDDAMEAELLAISSSSNTAPAQNASSLLKPQLELHSAESLYSKSQAKASTATEEEELVISSKSSIEDYETAHHGTSIADSVELLRMQRCARAHGGDGVAGGHKEHEPERSLSPDAGVGLRFRHDHERSAAPDRLHSSSISSIGSAVSASMSASASVNASKNASRRGSTASAAGEVLTANQLPPTPPPTAPLTTAPLTFPISKTSSTPNLQQRRKSSLSALFPGASPLVAPEPNIHSDPSAIAHLDETNVESKSRNDNEHREIPTGKFIHRTKTPPPVGVKLGVNLKRVSPPKTQITVKKNDAPMLGVVLRKVEKKTVPQKSILDDDKPLYHFSIVRSDHKEYKPSAEKPKPKPTTATLQKSATTAAITAKPNSGGIFSGPQVVRTAKGQQPVMMMKSQRPQPGVPITIQKIEGDKVIIIKKILIPKNGKIPEQYKVGVPVRIM